MKAKYVNILSGEDVYRQVVSMILKSKTSSISEAYSMQSSIKEKIGEQYTSAILGAIDFYYDDMTRELWEGRSIEEYMQKFM